MSSVNLNLKLKKFNMLVTSEPNSGPPSRAPSILDSPTLARVERARLRLEASTGQREDSLERRMLDPKVIYFFFKFYFQLWVMTYV